MLYRLALLWEILAIVACIHRIYDEKLRLEIKTVGLFLISLGMMEFINYFNINSTATLCVYIFTTLYCVYKFRDSIAGAIISNLLMVVVMVLAQFVAMFLIVLCVPAGTEWKMLLANMLVALFCLGLLRKMKLYKLRQILRKRDNIILIIFGIVILVAFLIMFEGKVFGSIHSSFFVVAVPILVLLLWMIRKWNGIQEEKEIIKSELSVTKDMHENYEDLLTAVRLREHGFKNHITALSSIRCGDNMEAEYEQYYAQIREANKYNKLLFLGNKVIAGFLHEKFCSIEENQVHVECDVKGDFSNNQIPVYHIVEILGILIDNAVEAQLHIEESRCLKFEFGENREQYWFKIANPFPYVNYSEVESWFQLNRSKKGKNRGLGLYYTKKLCEDYKMDIVCKNVDYEQKNWIEMTLEIQKADK